jgi:restriction endonuclease Mrr
MPIPDYQSLMRPLLAFASDGTEKRIGDAIEALATQLKLTDDERSQLLASGKQTIFANRVYPTRASSHVCNMADDERRFPYGRPPVGSAARRALRYNGHQEASSSTMYRNRFSRSWKRPTGGAEKVWDVD